MKISYNWLKQYLSFNLSPEETADYLTSCGLEVEGIDTFETVKGGLCGLVIGEVLTCDNHPDSDHLHITTVNVGAELPLNIVCGASNVAQGQKVIVATIGAVLYNGDESFVIKKSKIRGALSEGMICAEDEIGVGSSHDGIMVLEAQATPGTPAAKYFKVETDTIFEIGITPNRSDAISHYGVARDLQAILKANNVACSALMRPLDYEIMGNVRKNPIDITVENKTDCPRYSGMYIENIDVKESPVWLQNRLKSIGIRPINNIVDITQFVMFEIGQPLHAFDADSIVGNRIIVKNLPSGTPFVTLDGVEVKLDQSDLLICNESAPMCIAGVYGGLDSGVTENTQNIFLESAYFNPIAIRRTSKRHNLKTDAAFRFERGCDPEITLYALRRAAHLIKDIAGGLCTELTDIYPEEIERKKISLRYSEINKIAGKEIDKQMVSIILLSLGIEVCGSTDEVINLSIPLFKTDVTRPIDLIEEILRIYGYDKIQIPDILHYNINLINEPNQRLIQKKVSGYLANNGFFEIMNNSLSKESYVETFDFINQNETVKLLNPLSNELGVMRQTLLFGGLESVVRNINNKRGNLKLFEFGKIYKKNIAATRDDAVTEQYKEEEFMSFFVSGKTHDDLWNEKGNSLDFFYLKNIIENIFKLLNLPKADFVCSFEPDCRFIDHLVYEYNGTAFCRIGILHPSILKFFDIKKEVCYAEIEMSSLLALCSGRGVTYAQLPSFPSVKRDLALVVDKAITYETLEKIAYKYGSKQLKNVSLFDVYEGEKVEPGKKSYALTFVLQHADKTLTEEDITKIMNKLIAAFEREAGAKLR
ncbi:MAG TPA: phenylalanine--tRNA ligase subunit beta [Bacteroidales bacterium]|nr:phenylalanine--tRNA ligase subunit beta [Bacteroidales bacterium]